MRGVNIETPAKERGYKEKRTPFPFNSLAQIKYIRMKSLLLPILILLLITSIALAQEDTSSLEEFIKLRDEKLAELKEVDDVLMKEPNNAELCFKKGILIFYVYGILAKETVITAIKRAIELDPYNGEYRKSLDEITLIFIELEKSFRDEREQSFGDYTVWIFRDFESGKGRFQIFKDGSLVFAEDGYKFRIGHVYGNIPEESLIKMGNDITGDGEPNLIISHWFRGADCCYNYYVFSIGEEFKFINKIKAGRSGLSKFKDIDDDGVLEFIGNDWTFAYWHTIFTDSPAPAIILKYIDGKYRLAMDLMKRPLPPPQEEKAFIEQIRTDDRWEEGNDFSWLDWTNGDVTVPREVWSHMLDLIYTEHPKSAWQFLDKVWPQNKLGKEEFLADFNEKLAESPYWDQIKVIMESM